MTGDDASPPTRSATTARRPLAVVTCLVILSAGTGCASPSRVTGSDRPSTAAAEEYRGICVDPDTQIRLPDEQCRCLSEDNTWNTDDDCDERTRRRSSWYFVPLALAAVRIGQRASGGSFARPYRSRSWVPRGTSPDRSRPRIRRR